MPAAPRANSRATKMAYRIIGTPQNMINQKSAIKRPAANPGYGFSYGNALTSTILR